MKIQTLLDFDKVNETEGTEPKTLVVYPGRYQPFHKGHKAAYDYLTSKYDNVYIATSNKVDPPRSPFSFEEKKKMMELTGMDTTKVVLTKNPYNPMEIAGNFDKENTILLIAVSEKDMAEDPRFVFKPKKDGSPSYFQSAKDGNLETMDKHGYIITVPTFKFDVLGKPMKSATEVRSTFSKLDTKTKKELIKDLFGNYNNEVFGLMSKKITERINEDEFDKHPWYQDALAKYKAGDKSQLKIMHRIRMQALNKEFPDDIGDIHKWTDDEVEDAYYNDHPDKRPSYVRPRPHLKLVEGGWADTITQQTKLNPSVVKTALEVVKDFTNQFNVYLSKKGISNVEMGNPTGSSAYYKVDEPDFEYGDIDLQMIAVDDPEKTPMQIAGHYNKLMNDFIATTNLDYMYDTGKPANGQPIFTLPDGSHVQVDMLWAPKRVADFHRWRVTPQRGIKGLITGNLYGVLGEIMNMSLQHAAYMKIKDGEPVNYQKSRKVDKVIEVSRNIKKFGVEILQHIYKAVNGNLNGIVINDLLQKYPGLNTKDVQIIDLIKTIKGLAQAFEDNDLYGKWNLKEHGSKEEFLQAFMVKYVEKTDARANAAKLNKATTPAEKAKAQELRDKIAKGLKIVQKAFNESKQTKIKENNNMSSLNDKKIITYYNKLLTKSKKNWKDSDVKLSPLQDTISKFSHSGTDTTQIKKIIKGLKENMSSQKLGVFTKGKNKVSLWETDGVIVLFDRRSQRLQETQSSVSAAVKLLHDRGYVCESVNITAMQNAAGAIMNIFFDTIKKTTTVRDQQGGSHTYEQPSEKVIAALQKKGFQQIEDDSELSLVPIDKTKPGMAKPMGGLI